MPKTEKLELQVFVVKKEKVVFSVTTEPQVPQVFQVYEALMGYKANKVFQAHQD